MPWKEQRVVDQREEFIRAHLRATDGMAELCRRHGISRKTGYKWVSRFMSGGLPGLLDLSRAPRVHPRQVPLELVDMIIELRAQRSTWGPKKLRSQLAQKHPELAWPSESSFARILHREGLTAERRHRRRVPRAEHPLAVPKAPNDIWCADFKGKFRVDRQYCHPLTITDSFSRYVLCCSDTGAERFDPVRRAFERTFREHGMPLRIKTDNGSPFASGAVGGLSRLSVWWVKLGILPERSRPGHPQDNGRHERMHRTLKAETARPPRSTLDAQQAAFDAWVQDFNHERPHEALGLRPPAAVFSSSPREFPSRLEDPEYPDHFLVRRVRANGHFTLGSTEVALGKVLKAEAIGLEPLDDGFSQVWFGPVYLGLLTAHGKGKLTIDRSFPISRDR